MRKERLEGEIVPINAESSKVNPPMNENYPHETADKAIDMDISTTSSSVIDDSDTDASGPWFELTLEKVYCVESIILFWKADPTVEYNGQWSCTGDDCSTQCADRKYTNTCSMYTPKVYTAAGTAEATTPKQVDCYYGNKVKISREGKTSVVGISEIAVLGRFVEGKSSDYYF